jgi:undecaprenyl-diphosphatase
MLHSFLSGLVQGVLEWLPVSSQGALLLFFGANSLRWAFFLHLGTFFAALIYFRKEVLQLIKTLFNYRQAKEDNKKILNFLIVATLVSAFIGIFIYSFLKSINLPNINLLIGFLLLITAFVQWRAKRGGQRWEKDLNTGDGLVAGLAQGFSIFPGLSRSGLTISSLLMKNCNEETALRLSFLMSLPASLGASIILGWPGFSWIAVVGVASSFVFGLLTIKVLLNIAKKINFTWFVLIFAVLTIVASLIPGNQPVATVNGVKILVEDYQNKLDIVIAEMGDSLEIRESVLRQMIEEELLRQEAEKLGVSNVCQEKCLIDGVEVDYNEAISILEDKSIIIIK